MLPPRVRSVLLANSEGKNVIVPETVGRSVCEGSPSEGGDLSVVILYMYGTSHVVVGASVAGEGFMTVCTSDGGLCVAILSMFVVAVGITDEARAYGVGVG